MYEYGVVLGDSCRTCLPGSLSPPEPSANCQGEYAMFMPILLPSTSHPVAQKHGYTSRSTRVYGYSYMLAAVHTTISSAQGGKPRLLRRPLSWPCLVLPLRGARKPCPIVRARARAIVRVHGLPWHTLSAQRRCVGQRMEWIVGNPCGVPLFLPLLEAPWANNMRKTRRLIPAFVEGA